MKRTFWTFGDLKQPVNQWICIAFIALFAFWVILYFATQKAEAVGSSFSPHDLTYGL